MIRVRHRRVWLIVRLVAIGFGIRWLVWCGIAWAACVDCHRGIEAIAGGEMARQIQQLGSRHQDLAGCVVCHGGDPVAQDQASAHRGAPTRLAEAGGPRSFYSDPGDLRVAEWTCGQCHEGYAERVLKSVMSTGADAIGRQLCETAWQRTNPRTDAERRFGRYGILDKDGAAPVVGSATYKALMRELAARQPRSFPSQLFAVPPLAVSGPPGTVSASCSACHGESVRPRRHAGCSTCHIRYGRYPGADRTIDKRRQGTPLVHRIQGTGQTRITLPDGSEKSWSGIPLESCFQCHFDPRRISVNDSGDAFVHYGHQEDGGAGLLCQDCHTSIEMHGDGNIAATNAAQNEIRCDDCHGTVEKFPWELPLAAGVGEDDGASSLPARGVVSDGATAQGQGPAGGDYLLTSRGNPFGNVIRHGDQVSLRSVSGKVYEVTLLKQLATRQSWRSALSRQVKAAVGIHQGMACLDCHGDWLPTCSGCHGSDGSPAAASGQGFASGPLIERCPTPRLP